MDINGGIDFDSHTHHNQMIYKPDDVRMPKSVSLVISNYNHTDMALSLLGRIITFQTIIPSEFEIIVSDSGSMAENVAPILSFMDFNKNKIKLKFVYRDMAYAREKYGPAFHGAGFTMNMAAQVAEGDVLIYCDSSIIVPDNFIFEMAHPHVAPNFFVRAPLWDIKQENVNIIDKKTLYNMSYAQVLGSIDRSKLKHSMGRPAWSVRLEDYKKIGGMDEDMLYYGVSDDDFVTRLLMIGYKNMMSVSRVIHVWHPQIRDTYYGHNFHIMRSHINKGIWQVNKDKKWGYYDSLYDFTR